MSIHEIKNMTKETAPHFFERSTMKFFGQNMKSFKVYKQADGRYKITAPMKNSEGVIMGETLRYFNPANNKLEFS